VTVEAAELQPLVASWLPEQRWFAGKGRRMTISLRSLVDATEGVAELSLWIADVHYEDDGSSQAYQLPLVIRDQPVGVLEHVQVGTIERAGRMRWVYDALHDKDVTQWWLAGMRDELTTDTLRFQCGPDPELLPLDKQSLVLTGEQSNTSLVYGDDAILKVFRRLESGLNPDIEIHQALTELGARHIARLLGSLSARLDGTEVSLAMLQEFMTTATNGWELAKISVRDLMAEADLHAEEAGGDFAAEAERLGVATAEVHMDLGNAFGSDVLAADQLQSRAADMNARLDAALVIVPQLREVEVQLRGIFAAVAEDAKPVATQRIHGDLHLGQVLRTARRWVFLDFEGEPVASLAQRRAFDSPLRDIAGMLRSFDYAASHQIIDLGADQQRQYRAGEWSERNRNAFCNGYAQGAGWHPDDHDTLLRAFQADKAVYEAVYEARNRPSWLRIPLMSLSRLVRSSPHTKERS
jgi:maltokinase